MRRSFTHWPFWGLTHTVIAVIVVSIVIFWWLGDG